MKLFYSKGACSLAVRIVINELGLPCEFEAVDLKTKRTESGQDYLAINSKGAVPALLLDSGELLTENSVIQQYLADTFNGSKLLPKVGELKRYRVLEWLNFVGSDLHKGVGVFFNHALPDDIKNKYFKPGVESKIDFVNQSLAHKKYLLGDEFTLPDAYLFVIIVWLKHFKFDLKSRPYLTQYFDELNKRPSVLQSLEEEGMKMTTA
ncbi:MAG: glutathione transferase GstA [Gammaproteobacteria bacterium]|nr:glutathione transferase GstA [Gammaproteobacteria bacterium]